MSELFDDLQNCPKYSKEEIIELAKQHKNGDLKAREQLILSILPYALSIAVRFKGGSLEMDELKSVAFEGAIKAVDDFDPNMGYALTSYANSIIANSIIVELNKCDSVIGIPKYVSKGRGSESVINDARRVWRGIFSIEVLQEMKYSIESSVSVIDDVISHEESEMLKWAIDWLPDIEKPVILGVLEKRSYVDMAKEYGCTKQNIHQIKNRAIKHMREFLFGEEE